METKLHAVLEGDNDNEIRSTDDGRDNDKDKTVEERASNASEGQSQNLTTTLILRRQFGAHLLQLRNNLKRSSQLF